MNYHSFEIVWMFCWILGMFGWISGAISSNTKFVPCAIGMRVSDLDDEEKSLQPYGTKLSANRRDVISESESEYCFRSMFWLLVDGSPASKSFWSITGLNRQIINSELDSVIEVIPSNIPSPVNAFILSFSSDHTTNEGSPPPLSLLWFATLAHFFNCTFSCHSKSIIFSIS